MLYNALQSDQKTYLWSSQDHALGGATIRLFDFVFSLLRWHLLHTFQAKDAIELWTDNTPNAKDGADEFLQKPFSVADLRAVVDRLLAPAQQAPRTSTAVDPAHKATPHARLVQGLELLQAGNLDAALAALQDAERLDPFSAEVQHAIGRCHELGKQPFRAIYYHERAIELSPKLFGALHSLAQLYQSEGFLNKAREYWRRAAENASSPEMQRTIRAHLGESA